MRILLAECRKIVIKQYFAPNFSCRVQSTRHSALCVQLKHEVFGAVKKKFKNKFDLQK